MINNPGPTGANSRKSSPQGAPCLEGPERKLKKAAYRFTRGSVRSPRGCGLAATAVLYQNIIEPGQTAAALKTQCKVWCIISPVSFAHLRWPPSYPAQEPLPLILEMACSAWWSCAPEKRMEKILGSGVVRAVVQGIAAAVRQQPTRDCSCPTWSRGAPCTPPCGLGPPLLFTDCPSQMQAVAALAQAGSKLGFGPALPGIRLGVRAGGSLPGGHCAASAPENSPRCAVRAPRMPSRQ